MLRFIVNESLILLTLHSKWHLYVVLSSNCLTVCDFITNNDIVVSGITTLINDLCVVFNNWQTS